MHDVTLNNSDIILYTTANVTTLEEWYVKAV